MNEILSHLLRKRQEAKRYIEGPLFILAGTGHVKIG